MSSEVRKQPATSRFFDGGRERDVARLVRLGERFDV